MVWGGLRNNKIIKIIEFIFLKTKTEDIIATLFQSILPTFMMILSHK